VPISAQDIKKLRDMTGAGMMDAKKALEEAAGDEDKAIEILRKSGAASAAKRGEREAKAGLVDSYVHGGRIGVLIEVNCETDFVARTEDFKDFVHDVAMQVAATMPDYIKPEDVPEDVLNREREVYKADTEGKPVEVAEKIMAGKLDKYYEAVCLMRQPFIKDDKQTIEQLTQALIAKLGENIVIRRFQRFELGGE